ncbi:efflux RND transporter permease subunit, partial [Klebsiella pneumoniae]|uniref:efflux RND transporter permease subunit n=1 Tax=Klebsiella pneumoniae TaxID=573 RepID=UPI0013D650AF
LKKTFVGTDAFVKLLDIGPPVGRPVQYRLSGPDIQTVRTLAMNLGTAMASNRHLGDITFDWNEPARVIKVEVLQD